jgi:hypothetical protein
VLAGSALSVRDGGLPTAVRDFRQEKYSVGAISREPGRFSHHTGSPLPQPFIAIVTSILSAVASSSWAGLFILRLGGYALIGTVRALPRLFRSPIGTAVLGVAALGLLVTYPHWAHRICPAARALRTGARSSIDGILTMVTQIADGYREADEIWTQAMTGGRGRTLLHRAASALAVTPVPLSRTGLARLILPDASEGARRALVRDLGRLLPASAPFVPLSQRYWQLGRAGADFGVAAESDSVLQWDRSMNSSQALGGMDVRKRRAGAQAARSSHLRGNPRAGH